MAVPRRKDGVDKDAYIAESLRIWCQDPTLTLGQLRRRRGHFYQLTVDKIREQGLEHESLALFAAKRKSS